ncbi:MAG TPA: CopG family transcriptional regulator [Actinomycetota bacterium]|nr:CopG family transcriptional regulator [Actinomycetota bacterium]
MLNERLQILISGEQRRRLDAEAARRGTSVSALIREAIDRSLGGVRPEERMEALERIRAMRGRAPSTEEIERLVEEERRRAFPP